MSPVTLKLDHPNFPDDYEFGISELGRVKNHGTLEVSDEDAAAFEASKGMSLADAFANNSLITVGGQEATQQQAQQQEQQQAEPSAPSVPPTDTPPAEAGEQ